MDDGCWSKHAEQRPPMAEVEKTMDHLAALVSGADIPLAYPAPPRDDTESLSSAEWSEPAGLGTNPSWGSQRQATSLVLQVATNTTTQCPNCHGPHAAYSRTCEIFKKEKGIIQIKVMRNIAFTEARQKVSLFSRKTYADAAHRGAGRRLATVRTQYSFAGACTSRLPTKQPQAAPTFEVLQVHLHQTSETTQTIQTPQVNFHEASETTQTTERAPVPLEKPPSASKCSQGEMDVTPASSASPMLTEYLLVKRSPIERLRGKKHPPVQAPDRCCEVSITPLPFFLFKNGCREYHLLELPRSTEESG
ncbi:hypothetical protein HPB51_027634 [Rhipicephalus microplus]|uniref:Uncharacterized protein n=1 Tax=Rhipicephalus microplus TaxID=6941 RepID=A0A9J6CZU7_RHIMP|nr:hypothetical protein HPB51_027634 [Rhipicephalus microplus]